MAAEAGKMPILTKAAKGNLRKGIVSANKETLFKLLDLIEELEADREQWRMEAERLEGEIEKLQDRMDELTDYSDPFRGE